MLQNQCIVVIGFGFMGYGMVILLKCVGYVVIGCDVLVDVVVCFVGEGGFGVKMLVEVVKSADIVVSVVVNVVQIEVILFGKDGVVEILLQGSVFVFLVIMDFDVVWCFFK